jgi:ribosomal protein S18 acetylase RimI-like enzyme
VEKLMADVNTSQAGARAVRVCRATPADAADILKLQNVCYQSEAAIYDDYKIPPLLQTLKQLVDEFASMSILKATDGDAIIGSVRAYAEAGTCYVGRLIVHPSRQNQGVGRRLMAAIEEQFPNALRFELFTGDRSDKNLRLYGKLGYREFKRRAQGDKVTLVYMEKLGGDRGSRTRG